MELHNSGHYEIHIPLVLNENFLLQILTNLRCLINSAVETALLNHTRMNLKWEEFMKIVSFNCYRPKKPLNCSVHWLVIHVLVSGFCL
jgi:hypothetical protein